MFNLIKILNNYFFSRCANYLTQVLLRPGASDLTGSFRYFIFLYSQQVNIYTVVSLINECK